ncbi:hypothetical protein D9M73_230350 [compost metagenome]
MSVGARQENQAGASEQQLTPPQAFQRDRAGLQQVNMAALVGAIVGRHAAKLAAVKQVRAHSEL